MQIDISTPALLFPAVSLLLLAYTSRFLATGQLIRGLNSNRKIKDIPNIEQQINNLNKRMELIKIMQILGAVSLLFCTISMFLLFTNLIFWGKITFGISLISMSISMLYTIYEVMISTEAIKIELLSLHSKKNKNTKKGDLDV